MNNRIFSPTDKSKALQLFNNVADGWQLSQSERCQMLGLEDERATDRWLNSEMPAREDPVLLRISYVLGIYKALRTLYPNEDRANAWVKKNNRNFDGRAAIKVMLEGNLKAVRQYLDAQLV